MANHRVPKEDEDSQPVDLCCCVLLPEFDVQRVIKEKEEKEFGDGFGARVWVQELAACEQPHDWSYKVGDAMPAVLSRHGARASDWNEFLEEVRVIEMSPRLKTYKMLRGPFLVLLVITLVPLCTAAKGCSSRNSSGGICGAAYALIVTSCIVFGLPASLLLWFMAHPRREYEQKLTAVEEKFKAKFNADNETFVFKLRVCGAVRTLQGRVYIFHIQDKTRGGQDDASKNPMSAGLVGQVQTQAHHPHSSGRAHHKHGTGTGTSTGATTAAAASAGKDVEMGPMALD